MRPALAFSLFGLSILCSGCALVEDSSRNFMVAVTTPIETHRELARNRTWAENAWAKTCASSGPRGFSEDYAQGFKDGYAEYLYRGGDGEPPLLAPKRYRHLRYQTPQGYLAVEDWFAGYRHGAAVAHDTGARRWITGPTGWLPEPHTTMGHEPTNPTEQPETLPMPQPLPKAAIDQRPPEDVKVEVELPAFPNVVIETAPAIELPRAKIMGVSVPPVEVPEAPPKARIKGIIVPPTPEPEPKATIRGIIVPPPAPEASVEPVRVRIRTVTPAATKD